jgi:hypothetical protein
VGIHRGEEQRKENSTSYTRCFVEYFMKTLMSLFPEAAIIANRLYRTTFVLRFCINYVCGVHKYMWWVIFG